MSLTLKTNMMKKIIIIGMLIVCTLSCKAQVLPVENVVNYVNSKNGIPKNITSIKDVNHLLDKFIGTWKGTYEGKNYEFRVLKITTKPGRITEEKLVMRYLITNSNGTVIEDTRALPDSSPYVIEGYYLDTTTYTLIYGGKIANCGQAGTIFIDFLQGSNNTKMTLFLSPEPMIISQTGCPNGRAKQIIPTVNQMTLLKQ
ncbi:DUF6705 family protein [Flavobacterium sp. 140616W15]|uniref:DUF6705 family protein n=1 Tax=Flavobacterium sp. 140616W15 TaxID=2478552 RepID=UPI000F0CAA4D|nr:DUF6705 family protein [Flavobacterium sp. 140616W15]AYN05476.1 hypothetical protein EAG11_15960 [Flavobacterium sp. 140616W15]